MQRNWDRYLLNHQAFKRIGKNKYIPIYPPYDSNPLYVWDDIKKEIAPVNTKYLSEDESMSKGLENSGDIN